MYRLGKYYSLCLVVILAFSVLLLIAEPIDAQTIPKPSVPEFTLTFVSHPYDVPTTTTTTVDPYTGEKTVTTHPGYHVDNKSLEIQITNQPFTPYYDGETRIELYYNISYKGHYEDKWEYYWADKYGGFFSQSSSDYTIITFPRLPEKGEVDFRVQAQIGYFGSYVTYPQGVAYSFGGQVSGWSNTQKLTLPEAPNTGTPTPSPTVPEFSFMAILALLVVLPLIIVSLVKKRNWLKGFSF